MLLYHASQKNFSVIKRNQATAAEGLSVPAGELQNKIYVTPNLGFALAMAAGPDGVTSLHAGEISFERVEEFDPEAMIYVYIIESGGVQPELLEYIDENQYTIDADEVMPESVVNYKAKDVFNYYQLVDFKSRPSKEYI